MADYYETLGAILRNQLDDSTDIFSATKKKKQNSNQFTAKKTKQHSFLQTEHDTNIRVPVPQALVEDFATLHVLPGVPLFDCKQARKQLLKKYHPDFAPDEKAQAEAAAVVRRINQSYKRIETWFSTGIITD